MQAFIRDILTTQTTRGLEDFILDYAVGMSVEMLENGEDLLQILPRFLVSYAAVRSEAQAVDICTQITSKAASLLPAPVEVVAEVLEAPVRIGDHTARYKASMPLGKGGRVVEELVITKREEKAIKKPRSRRVVEATDAVLISGTSGRRGGTLNLSAVSLQPKEGGDGLLSDAVLNFVDGRRYGLVGRNGVGKSTLLEALSRRDIDKMPDDVRIVHVLQECVGDSRTALETVLAVEGKKEALLAEEKELVAATQDTAGNERLGEIHEELMKLDQWDSEAKAKRILSGLQFSNQMMTGLGTKSLSGGWRMRVALATALMAQPDMLLLDEPTNHLDFPSVLWLEQYLTEEFDGTIIVVSHDRIFLNNVVTDVIHFQGMALNYYRGNFDSFEKQREEHRKNTVRQQEAIERKQKHIQKFIDKFRFNAKRAALVQSRIKALDKLNREMEELMDPSMVDDPLFKFNFPTPSRLDKEIIASEEVCFKYTPDGPLLINKISVRVTPKSRIGILGANGAGKTTLLKVLLGELEPISGYSYVNKNADIAIFAQHHVDQLDLTDSALTHIIKNFPKAPTQDIRSHLGQFGLSGDLATRPISTLSGGQKSRVSFATSTFSKPHLLIMDEPTNHLDLETVDALIMAIRVYQGGVLTVSHDQYFLSSASEEFWTLSDGNINLFHSFDEAKQFSYPKSA